MLFYPHAKRAAEKTAQEIQKLSNAKVHLAQFFNVTDTAPRKSLVGQVQKITPELDILIHNVGGPKTGSGSGYYH